MRLKVFQNHSNFIKLNKTKDNIIIIVKFTRTLEYER